MAVVGPIVRNEIFFFGIILGAAALLFSANGWLLAAGLSSNVPRHRKHSRQPCREQPSIRGEQAAPRRPELCRKKKISLRTIGPTTAISILLDGSHIASLNFMNPGPGPVNGDKNEDRAGCCEKSSKRDLKRPLEEEPPNGNRHTQAPGWCRSILPAPRWKAPRRVGSGPVRPLP